MPKTPIQFQGTIEKREVISNTQGFGNALYPTSGSTWGDAQADVITTLPCRALAIDTGVGLDKRVLLFGEMYDPAWTWSPGGILYVSELTAGLLTQTVPTSGFRQKVGWAIDSDLIWFYPDQTTIPVIV